ncbi:hypothetical protein Ahu01nite_079180 [Winogradskya humida]|uniref:Uncharacterized protein n=1 Tax=Winogradskya humida TaxID=113566 RepID=A0ABQ4A1T1_9ACTN|nr:hypothetical protein Ahu01nite_079180 [Actinoplanes humidus]
MQPRFFYVWRFSAIKKGATFVDFQANPRQEAVYYFKVRGAGQTPDATLIADLAHSPVPGCRITNDGSNVDELAGARIGHTTNKRVHIT